MQMYGMSAVTKVNGIMQRWLFIVELAVSRGLTVIVEMAHNPIFLDVCFYVVA